MTKATPPELIDWLYEQLDRLGQTGAEASRRAGLNVGAISEIVNGRTPGLRVCKALARYFGASPGYVLGLAGHLPTPSKDGNDPELDALVLEIQAIWRDIKRLDKPTADRLARLAMMQAEMAEAALRAGRGIEETPANSPEEEKVRRD